MGVCVCACVFNTCRRRLTVSAGLVVLQQLHAGGTGTLVVRLDRRKQAQVRTAAVFH